MRYICIALTLLFICLGNYSSAQIIKPRWSPIEYHVQNRLFQKGLGYQTFHTQIDIGFAGPKEFESIAEEGEEDEDSSDEKDWCL